MKVLIILEFGIPPYRDFLFKFLNEQPEITDFLVVHTGQKFPRFDYSYQTLEVETYRFINIYFHKDILHLIKEYDIIISSFHVFRPMCWLPLIWFNKKKWILWMTGIGRNNFPNLNRFFRTYFIDKANSLIVYTNQARNKVIKEWGLPPEKVKVSNNTLKVENAGLIQEDKKYFLYVGRIQERKGLMKSLETIYKLRENFDISIPFIIVGDGDYKKVLLEFVEKNNMGDLISFYPGTYSDNELKSYYKNAITYLSPDHVGLGVVHSFSYGIPIMTCKNKPHAEEFNYCNDQNSFLYERDEDLYNCIKVVFQNKGGSVIKGRSAYSFYKENLDYQIMNQTFLKAIK